MSACALTRHSAQYQLTTGWEGWDLFHVQTEWRLEVKQSAARQVGQGEIIVTPTEGTVSFDIKPRAGEYDAAGMWKPYATPRRTAHAYIFAWHGRAGETCDQRDPLQWEFYVIDRAALRDKKSKISLRAIRNLAGASGCRWSELRERVEVVRNASWPSGL
jgi:hypothetical protein